MTLQKDRRSWRWHPPGSSIDQNFGNSSGKTEIVHHDLDQAVEKLWISEEDICEVCVERVKSSLWRYPLLPDVYKRQMQATTPQRMRSDLKSLMDGDPKTLFTTKACHIFAVELLTRLATVGFKLRRLAAKKSDLPTQQAIHVYVAANNVAFDVSGQQSEADLRSEWEKRVSPEGGLSLIHI